MFLLGYQLLKLVPVSSCLILSQLVGQILYFRHGAVAQGSIEAVHVDLKSIDEAANCHFLPTELLYSLFVYHCIKLFSASFHVFSELGPQLPIELRRRHFIIGQHQCGAGPVSEKGFNYPSDPVFMVDCLWGPFLLFQRALKVLDWGDGKSTLIKQLKTEVSESPKKSRNRLLVV